MFLKSIFYDVTVALFLVILCGGQVGSGEGGTGECRGKNIDAGGSQLRGVGFWELVNWAGLQFLSSTINPITRQLFMLSLGLVQWTRVN